jgi:hypothetical protein
MALGVDVKIAGPPAVDIIQRNSGGNVPVFSHARRLMDYDSIAIIGM